MKILAIDTATEACSAALYINGELKSVYQLAPREHSRLILKMIDGLLAEAELTVSQLDAIAFGRGPGSFMGLRIAAGVVQGIAFAHDIPVIAISTLKTIAQRAFEQTKHNHILVAIDARMDEVYWAVYSKDLKSGNEQQWQLTGEEQVVSPDKIQLPEELTQPGKTWIGAGTGWANYADRLLADNVLTLQEMLPDCLPSAEAIATLAVNEYNAGNTIIAAQAIPVYLRNDVAKKPKPVVL
ncbi:tRNA (adenosine(37)-N6)-threonylcarbamoyltransferase complex dimerization subunit type 1 TsaB [Cardiobacterium sp. AH-315-I02]|nr:tRNA (adenosine(37)-N6)-threonylcarbamoyltransferase complex dimerization subunit type 1 TsaB [Cardiobacterium sp. AH-315-I02]